MDRPTLDPDVASALPAYELGDVLGNGAWGVVIAARHRTLGRDVAVKQLPRGFGADPAVRSRFTTEARLLAALDHPHIVPIYDYVEHDDLCLLIMERLTGGTVWDRFRDDGFTDRAASALVVAACAALHYAHQKGVLHRDVKPENLMFSGEAVIKVTDFGIAKVVGGAATMATKAGAVLGTPAYIAPEQAISGELSPATDVYALGTVLYELLAGRLPYPVTSDPVTVLYQHVHEEHRPLRDVAPGVPFQIADVVAMALQRSPEDRHVSAEAFGVALATASIEAWGPQWSTGTGITLRGTDAIIGRAHETARATVPTSPPSFVTPPAMRAVDEEHKPAAATGADLAASDLVPVSKLGDFSPTIAPDRPPVTPPPPASPSPPAPATRGRRLAGVMVVPAIVIIIAALAIVISRGSGNGGTTGGPASSGPITLQVPQQIGTFKLTEDSSPASPEGKEVVALYEEDGEGQILSFSASVYDSVADARAKFEETAADVARTFVAGTPTSTRTVDGVQYTCATGNTKTGPNPFTSCSWVKGRVAFGIVGPPIGVEGIAPLAADATQKTGAP